MSGDSFLFLHTDASFLHRKKKQWTTHKGIFTVGIHLEDVAPTDKNELIRMSKDKLQIHAYQSWNIYVCAWSQFCHFWLPQMDSLPAEPNVK